MARRKNRNSPHPLLTLNQERVLASDIRNDILTNAEIYGGHLSSNLGIVELTIALLKHFDCYRDDILFDVGHQTYAYKILTGRSLHGLRQYGGVSPFSDPDSSPADKYRNGHAATSISVAYGMALAKRHDGVESDTIAVVGDASIVSGLSMEALSLLANEKSMRLIIVLNDNGMSIGKDVSFLGKQFQKIRNSLFYFRTSNLLGRVMSRRPWTWRLFLKFRDLKDTIRRMTIAPTIFETMGIKYIGPFDGHDFESLDLAFRKAKSLVRNGPVVVHVVTKKGYGYAPAMNDEKGTFHGVPKRFEEERPAEDVSFTSLKAKLLQEKMEQDRKAFLITPAMVYGSRLEELFRRFPRRTLDVGIAEENAVTLSSGLALKGQHPIVDIYSTFLQRSYDEVMEDVARERIGVLFFVERAGLVGEDGESHQGLYDVSFLKGIPGTRVYLPYDEKSLLRLVNSRWFDRPVPTFFRLPKDLPFALPNCEETEICDFCGGRGTYRTLVLATGPNGARLLSLLEGLPTDRAILLNLLPSEEELRRLLEGYERVFFYDSYSTREGTDEFIASFLAREGRNVCYRSFSFPRTFVTHGDLPTLYQVYRLLPEQVAQSIRKELL